MEVADEDAALLSYVADLGLLPGVRMEVLAKAPFDGPIQIRVGENEYALGETVARAIAVVIADREVHTETGSRKAGNITGRTSAK